uniref:C-type lectin domain-containing protein n=1 Tax=Sphaeramia orbicularis TaxID=375764 RepID=A0A673C0A9_9TELE
MQNPHLNRAVCKTLHLLTFVRALLVNHPQTANSPTCQILDCARKLVHANWDLCRTGKVRIIRRHPPSTWEKAFDYCNKNHTGLLWIQDQEDQKAVQQWLEHPPSDEHFWIGLRQSRVFGFWIWMSNRMVSYSNWENDTQPKQPLSYQCGAISGQTFRWTDENCQRKLPFLCEEEISFMNP